MKKSLFLILLAIPALTFAETDDVGLRLGVGIEKSLSKKVALDGEVEYRMKDNISTTDRLLFSLGTDYKITKWLKADAGYTFMTDRTAGTYSSTGKWYNSTYWAPMHRFHASLTGTLKSGRWKFSLRERWVYTYRPEHDINQLNMDVLQDIGISDIRTKTKNGKAENVLRSRLAADYNIRHCPITPYGSIEFYTAKKLQKIRYTIGADYTINKHHTVSLYYLFQDRKSTTATDDNTTDQHIIGAKYSLKL